jgi:cytochrome c-type biogenesis protein CcmH/NrfG
MSEGKKLPVLSSRTPLDLSAPAAVQELLEGDSAAVIAALKEHLEGQPDDERAWLQLGLAYMTIEHWGLAMAALERAVELDGDVLDARLMYARVLNRLRRPDKAAFQLVQAKRLAPGDARVAQRLGMTFYDKGLHDKALRELERSRELEPEDARTHFALGLVHEAKADSAASIAAFREAVRIDPGFADARKTLADALTAMGELTEAVEQLRAVLRLEPTNVKNALNLEVLEKRLAELEQARLLGKLEADVQRCTVLHKAQLKRSGRILEQGAAPVVRYTGELAELWLTSDADGRITRMMLLLPDPQKAAARSGAEFEVTVLSASGQRNTADYATAISLTFLREALGCTMTQASARYAELLAGAAPSRWGGAELGFAAVDAPSGSGQLHGLYVAIVA